MTLASDLEEILSVALRAGYSVEAVELEGGVKVRLRALDGVPIPVAKSRLPEESDDAFAARETEARKAKDRDGHIRRYTKELGRGKATAFVDKCLAAGGVVP